MTAIKESSTIQENKQFAFNQCPVTYIMQRIGGHWKPIILFHLLTGSKRYNELKRAIPTITEKMLIQHLKQLENDNLVVRVAKPVVPPYVTYSLSESGERLRPVLHAMANWAIEDAEVNAGNIYADKRMSNFPE
ncbi:winged helix-turn-helix transcriptional regulator [Mucilaginibacter pedocola]|uniref:Transcriptional regulator n=1 Tax=Mucilaginibacter pedocola TaxID=1792845 RepID=A0A1S9PKM5_9SPHI|nr:helix-turn-helix domain-containing protein [Mucilaginibacter pedocola]OOQ61500.1 transcriptional regulator [Mucilaginibacter pedocola]